MRLIGTLALALLLAGCGNGTPLAPTNVNATGTWQGTIVIVAQSQPLRLSIFQREAELTGTWAIGSTGGSLGGQVAGSAVALTLRDASSCSVTITASVTDARMLGTYAVAGACGGTSAGSIDLRRL